jgi:uncharacterized membrane protein
MKVLATTRSFATGIATGSRSLLPLAMTLAAGKSPWAGLAGTLAAGELIGDKLPFAPARIEAIPLAGRAFCGALCGWLLAARDGSARPVAAGVGASAAVASTLAGYYARKFLTHELGIPDPLIALAEDGIVFGLARFANG